MPEVCHGPEKLAIPGSASHRHGGRDRDRRQVPGHAPIPGTPVPPATSFAKLSGGTEHANGPERCRRLRHGSGRRAGRSARMPGERHLPNPREKSEGDHPIKMVPAPGNAKDTRSRLWPGPNCLRVIRNRLRAGVIAVFHGGSCRGRREKVKNRSFFRACGELRAEKQVANNIHHHPVRQSLRTGGVPWGRPVIPGGPRRHRVVDTRVGIREALS